MAHFTVTGQHGTLMVDAETGVIASRATAGHAGTVDGELASCDCAGSVEGEGYAKIARFDLDEWRKAYPDEDPAGMAIDILDLGYWLEDGTYGPPEEDYRAEIRAARAD